MEIKPPFRAKTKRAFAHRSSLTDVEERLMAVGGGCVPVIGGSEQDLIALHT